MNTCFRASPLPAPSTIARVRSVGFLTYGPYREAERPALRAAWERHTLARLGSLFLIPNMPGLYDLVVALADPSEARVARCARRITVFGFRMQAVYDQEARLVVTVRMERRTVHSSVTPRQGAVLNSPRGLSWAYPRLRTVCRGHDPLTDLGILDAALPSPSLSAVARLPCTRRRVPQQLGVQAGTL